MIEATPRLALPLLQPGQAQKEMFHNEALVRLDLLAHGSVVAHDAINPPEDPQPGQCWLLANEPADAWENRGGTVAGWTTGGWRFLSPCEGMRLWCTDIGAETVFRSGEWQFGAVHGRLFVEGLQVVGPRVDAVAEPQGGMVVDAEARAAIAAVLDVLRVHGLVEND